MLLTDITRIVRTLLDVFEQVGPQDELTRRRVVQMDQVVGAVEDVAWTEGAPDLNVTARRMEEAHDIIHRIAAILAIEQMDAEALPEIPWNGRLKGETIDLCEEEE